MSLRVKITKVNIGKLATEIQKRLKLLSIKLLKLKGWISDAKFGQEFANVRARIQKIPNLRKKVRIVAFVSTILLLTILIVPLLPELIFKLQPLGDNDSKPTYPVEYVSGDKGKEEKRYRTDGNRLFIPRINVDTKILESATEDVMFREEGTWHDPVTGNPTKPGNMVLAGHRFQYLPPNTTTFYNLDKLSLGDNINVYWEGVEYIYKVNEIFEVNPDEVWIKQPASESAHEVTLYTCTPLYTSNKRLVIKAERV